MSEPKVNLQGGGRTDNFGRLNAIYVNIKRMFGIPTGTAEYLLGLDENQNLVKTVDGGGGGAGLVDGDYGDVVVSGVGTVMTIDDLAVTTAKIADNAVELGKIQAIGQHKLIGRHSTGDGIPHQIGVTNGIEFTGQDIGIADSGVTQAKLDATGAAAGKVLTTDGTAMTWETPAGGGLTLPIDEIYGGADGTTAMKLQVVGGANSTPSYITAIEANLNGGDGTYGNIALQVANLSGGDTHYPIIIKNGPKISSGAGGAYNEHNYFSVMGYNVHIGGNFGTTYTNILNGIKIDTTDNTIRIHNPADPAQYLDINYNGIPIGDGSVTETKLGDSSVTETKLGDSSVTQAKISATGADVGKVLTTDGTTMTWETPNTAPTGTANNTTRFNASGQLVETNVIAISDAADVIVTGETFDVSLTGGSYIYMDNTSSYLSLQNGDNLDGGGLILSNPGGPNLTYGLDTADSIAGQSVTYLVKLDANTYTGNGSILVGEYDVAEDVPKWAFRNIANYTSVGTLNGSFVVNPQNNQTQFPANYIENQLLKAVNYLDLSSSVITARNIDTISISNYAPPSYFRNQVMFDGTSVYFTGTTKTIPLQKTNDFFVFTLDDTPALLKSFAPKASTFVGWTDVANNSFVVVVQAAHSANMIYGFFICTNGVWSNFIPPPKVGGHYNAIGLGANANVVWQNGVLSCRSTSSVGGDSRWYTTNLGVTWQQCTGVTITDFQIHRMSNGTLYNGQSGGVRSSIDNGISWQNMANLPVNPTTQKPYHNVDFNGTTYVAVCEGTNSVYTATTLTGGWTATTSAFTSSTPKHVYWCGDLFIALAAASQTNAVMTSPDGITWTQRTISAAAVMENAVKVGNSYVVTGGTRTERTTAIGTAFTNIATFGASTADRGECLAYNTTNVAIASASGSVLRHNGATNATTTITASQQNGDYCTPYSTTLPQMIKYR